MSAKSLAGWAANPRQQHLGQNVVLTKNHFAWGNKKTDKTFLRNHRVRKKQSKGCKQETSKGQQQPIAWHQSHYSGNQQHNLLDR